MFRIYEKNFASFLKLKNDILKNNITLLRLDCMNPCKALNFLKEQNNNLKITNNSITNIDNFWRNRFKITNENPYFLTKGVRSSLSKLFDFFKKDKILYIPSDIYPVYKHLAEINNINYKFYESGREYKLINILPNDDNALLLLTFPSSPHGKNLTYGEINILKNWVNYKNRLIVIDSVYAYNNECTKYFNSLLETNKVIICYSLSKNFIDPQIMGINYIPTDLEKFFGINEEQLDLAQVRTILDKNQNLPDQQQNLFHLRWTKLSSTLRRIFPQWQVPTNGYFSTLPINFNTLLNEHKILSIPSTVFGHKNDDYSIITCLHDNDIYQKKREKYYVTVASNFASNYDKYTRLYSKTNNHKHKNIFFLLDKENINIGIDKGQNLLNKLNIPNDHLIAIKTVLPDNEKLSPNNITETQLGETINKSSIKVEEIYKIESFKFNKQIIENLYSFSLKINSNKLINYNELSPRTISILPISKGCQAKCKFCFSHSSISTDQKQFVLKNDMINKILFMAKKNGSIRAVITGGGEPMLIPFNKLLEIIKSSSKYFKKVVLITNGYEISKQNDDNRRIMLLDLEKSGLSILSISRHGFDEIMNKKIMSLETNADKILQSYNEIIKNKSLKMKIRCICVLQKNGIEDEKSLIKYIDWINLMGVGEICFKELYVASNIESLYFDKFANQWSYENQVSLSLVINFLEKNNAKLISQLPWGSPIYELNWKNKNIIIACYTEPNVFWERTKGICRSWNLMADGKCYASLEDKNSLVSF